MFTKMIYVCSPLGGDIERNINKALGYCRFVYSKGVVPLAPHSIFTQFLDDNIQEERVAGTQMGLRLLRRCDEVWVFGDTISEGMAAEIKLAQQMGFKILYFNERCEAYD